MSGTAWISDDGKYRYRLTRRFGQGRDLVFVMLNPSTADAEKDDPTIRKCRGFAARMSYGGIVVVNLFAMRATDPAELWKVPLTTREGPENELTWKNAIGGADAVLAWGANARHPDAVYTARRLEQWASAWARRMIVLRRLSDGIPAHPLMLPYSCLDALKESA